MYLELQLSQVKPKLNATARALNPNVIHQCKRTRVPRITMLECIKWEYVYGKLVVRCNEEFSQIVINT